MSPGDIGRLVLTWLLGTDTKAQLVWHIINKGSGTPTATQILAAVTNLIEAAWLSIDNIITSDLVCTSLELLVWDFVNHRWDGAGTQVPTAMDGLGAGEYLPAGNAALCKVFTQQNRRQARKFIPGLLEGGVADGYITSGNLVLFAQFMYDFQTDFTAGGHSFRFVTFNTDDLSPLYETASETIDEVGAEANIAYQRRRKPGVGLT